MHPWTSPGGQATGAPSHGVASVWVPGVPWLWKCCFEHFSPTRDYGTVEYPVKPQALLAGSGSCVSVLFWQP